MKSLTRALAVVVALSIAAPAWAGDTEDTITEKKSDLKRSARHAKADVTGKETTEDKVENTKDAARSSAAKTRKSARKAKRKVKDAVEDAKD